MATERKKRAINSQGRRRILKALPKDAATCVNEDGYSSKSKFLIASLQFHDDICNLCKLPNKVQLVESIPAGMGRKLNGIGVAFMQADQLDNGSYVPLQNMPQEYVAGYSKRLKTNTNPNVAITPQPQLIQIRSSPETAPSREISLLKEQLARQAAQFEVKESKPQAAKK